MDNLFTFSCREALLLMIKDMNVSKSDKLKMFNFVVNEATDYQILHMVYEDCLPEKKNDIILENAYLKKSILVLENTFLLEKRNTSASEYLKNSIDKLKELSHNIMNELRYSSDEILRLNAKADEVSKKLKGESNPGVKERYKKELDRLTDLTIDYIARKEGLLARNRDISEKMFELGQELDNAKKYDISYGRYKIATNVAIGALVAGIIALSWKIYKNRFSKAARACKGLKGWKKDECMEKFKNDALKARIAAIKSQMSKCSKSSNPEKCKRLLNAKISKLEAKIKK